MFYLLILNITNIDAVIAIIGEIVTDERNIDKNCKIYINVSTSSKLFAIIASYFASFYPKNILPFYLMTSKYLIARIVKNPKLSKEFEEHGLSEGLFVRMWLPVLPFMEIKKASKDVLRILQEAESNTTRHNIKSITEALGLDYDVQRNRQRLSFWLKRLQELSLLEMEKSAYPMILKLQTWARYLLKC
jgi:hypothetical protein